MVLRRIYAMLEACCGDCPLFPPTVFFNENWMLRVLLDWYATHGRQLPFLGFAETAKWYSEPLLPSAFLPRYRGDLLSEGYTHADGVIGHFRIGQTGKGDLGLSSHATQLVVLEGKMFTRLSPGVKNARTFDQAARSVACIAEVLRIAGSAAAEMSSLGFYVIAPRSRIADGIFADEMNPASIRRKVLQRVERYAGARDQWFREWFEPAMERMAIECISWEDLITKVAAANDIAGREINDFYRKCLRFNQPPEPGAG